LIYKQNLPWLFAMGDFCHFADKFTFLVEDIEKSAKMLFVA
jgi:hypothetical protein